MENNSKELKEYFMSIFRQKAEHGFRNAYFGWETPSPEKHFAAHPHPRIMLTVKGHDQLEISDSGTIREIAIDPQDILFTVTGGWTISTKRKLLSTISVVFFEDFTRIVEGKYRDNVLVDKFWYHTCQKISETTFFLIRALENASREKGTARDILLLKALLLSLEQELKNDTPNPGNRAWYTYHRIVNYITANFNTPINRATASGDLKINECHISKLFKRYSKETFNSMLKRFRMNHAVKLLSSPSSPTVAEVAEHCGFENTDYFIKAFKVHYKTTPACFRQRNIK